MQSLQQFTAIEQDALKRIHALADEEGRRRFHEAAEQWRFPLGDYDGKLCATTADVARAFGVSRQAVVKLLADANGDLPGAAATIGGEDLRRLCNLKLQSRTPRVTLVFWPGFLFCAHRGRSDAAAQIVKDLMGYEREERLAKAGGQVLTEEYAALVEDRNRLALALNAARSELAQRQVADLTAGHAALVRTASDQQRTLNVLYERANRTDIDVAALEFTADKLEVDVRQRPMRSEVDGLLRPLRDRIAEVAGEVVRTYSQARRSDDQLTSKLDDAEDRIRTLERRLAAVEREQRPDDRRPTQPSSPKRRGGGR